MSGRMRWKAGARRGAETGFTLIETMIALGILMVVAAGVLPLGLIAMNATENQGHLLARTVEYAQDKLEQLMALSYNDSTTDTRVFPATDNGGSGLTIGGNANPNAPVALYVDYLDAAGTLVPSAGAAEPNGWFYKRVWSVTAGPQANLKRITVTATVRSSAAGAAGGLIPRATVTVLKTSPF